MGRQRAAARGGSEAAGVASARCEAWLWWTAREMRTSVALLPLAIALPGGHSTPSASSSGGCGDAAADNYDPSSVTPPGNNSACIYLCTTLLARFELEPVVEEVLRVLVLGAVKHVLQELSLGR